MAIYFPCCCLNLLPFRTFHISNVCVFGDTDTVKSVSVLEGDSVTLNSKTKKILVSDLFLSFKNRLKLENQTGSLIITNTRTTDTGLYEVTISNSIVVQTRNFCAFSISIIVSLYHMAVFSRIKMKCFVQMVSITNVFIVLITEQTHFYFSLFQLVCLFL
uniref:Immunoglobulin subtype domain-containing protein n=1 Tax=Cyprinus carpio TaxID=7962 RepID=A0A8C2HX55_CYPCA